MDGTEFDKLIEQGRGFGFEGRELYDFVERERTKRKEERDAERAYFRQLAEFEMEQEREKSLLRIQKEKERLGLCATESGLSLAARTPSSVTDRVPNKQSYQDHVQLLRQKIESRRRMLETWDARHERGKETVGARPLRARQKFCTVEANIRFASESTELAAESPVVATKATGGRSDGDEALCLESLVDTEMPSVIDLAQPPCMGVAMAANCYVHSTTGPADEDPCTDSGTEACAYAHCQLGNVGASSSSRCERCNPEEDACIAQHSSKFPVSQGVRKLEKDPGCIDSTADETDETSSVLQMMQADFSKVITGQWVKRKRRRESKRKTKGAKPPKKSRIAEVQTKQRKIRLRVVTFARRARPHAPNHPKGRGVRQAIVAAAPKSQLPPLHSCVRGAECTGKERIMARRRDVVARPISVEPGVDDGLLPRGRLKGNRCPCSARTRFCLPRLLRMAPPRARPPRARIKLMYMYIET
ncbi:hypothetical protein HPB51_004391 [Rhipicephalus microplus]|uniref:Uncharacterized protein n=1 Tax=Rhipicephalus microplus TaxID=6941 RepID=A0A9J6ELC6_RHIMP|nr:hypothetical protein HPB51_004391 [Rhipicephalus microplus]